MTDDLAIAEAIEQVENELNQTTKKTRSDSLVDSVTKVDLDEMDENLRGIEPASKSDVSGENVERAPEGK